MARVSNGGLIRPEALLARVEALKATGSKDIVRDGWRWWKTSPSHSWRIREAFDDGIRGYGGDSASENREMTILPLCKSAMDNRDVVPPPYNCPKNAATIQHFPF